MMTSLFRFAGVLALALTIMAGSALAQDAPTRMVQMKKAVVADCTPANLARAVNQTPDNLSEGYTSQLMTWCRTQQRAEKAAEAKAASLSSSRAPKSPDPTQVAMDDETLALWCGRNNCFCWKGKKYDGCHHTDIMCRPNTFKCVGKVCGCTTVE